MAQRPPGQDVEPLPARVGGYFRGKTRQQQAVQGVRLVPLQAEEILELANHTLDDLLRLPAVQRRASSGHARREFSLGVAATSAPWHSSHHRSHAS